MNGAGNPLVSHKTKGSIKQLFCLFSIAVKENFFHDV